MKYEHGQLKKGASAPKAAGVIHTDLKKVLSVRRLLLLRIISFMEANKKLKKQEKFALRVRNILCKMEMLFILGLMYD